MQSVRNRPQAIREVATKEQLDRIMWMEFARHLTAIAAAIQRRYTESIESKEGPRP